MPESLVNNVLFVRSSSRVILKAGVDPAANVYSLFTPLNENPCVAFIVAENITRSVGFGKNNLSPTT